MTLLEKLKASQRRRAEMRKAIDEKNARGFEKGIQFEKGDLFAIIVTGLINFALPIMLIMAAVYGLAYFLFSGVL